MSRSGEDAPRVCVVIPTLNAGEGFRELLVSLDAQRTSFDFEVLVVDSGSTDGTVELARRHGAQVRRIPREGFDHGATRDLGICLCDGEYVALTVQDAVPLGESWLSSMVEAFERDERVAGVYGRQVARPQSGALARVLVEGMPTASLERREQRLKVSQSYSNLGPAERLRLATFDNVSSCVRRSVWERFPFGKSGFGEDLRWGEKVVREGYALVYEPRSAVFHSHERSALHDLRRHYVNQLLLLELFGFSPVPNLPSLALGLLLSSGHLYRALRRLKPSGSGKPPPGILGCASLAVKHAAVSQAGAYLGAKSGRLAGTFPTLHARLDSFLKKGI